VLAGLVHGPEMNTLSVYVASPGELTDICGPGALACYAPGISEMVVSGAFAGPADRGWEPPWMAPEARRRP